MTYLHEEQIPRVLDPETGLPVGPVLQDPGPASWPERRILEGQYCRLEPVDPARHTHELFVACTPPDAPQRFRYLFEASPQSESELEQRLTTLASLRDPITFAVCDKGKGTVEGRQALMRIAPEHRSIEIGSIYWGPKIARTRVTTEANYLLAQYVFEELQYRRYEWKCDALNAPSRASAERFGFTYEGTFRRMMIIKGRTRDTAWFSIIDEEWPLLKAAYETWLDPGNFDGNGHQKQRLSILTAAALRTAAVRIADSEFY